MKLVKDILLEGLVLWKIDALIKTDAKFNKVDIFNQIRGLPNVVVLTVRQSDFLDSKATNLAEFSLVRIKFLARKEPSDELNSIKINAMKGESRILGLLQFMPKLTTLKKVDAY